MWTGKTEEEIMGSTEAAMQEAQLAALELAWAHAELMSQLAEQASKQAYQAWAHAQQVWEEAWEATRQVDQAWEATRQAWKRKEQVRAQVELAKSLIPNPTKEE